MRRCREGGSAYRVKNGKADVDTDWGGRCGPGSGLSRLYGPCILSSAVDSKAAAKAGANAPVAAMPPPLWSRYPLRPSKSLRRLWSFQPPKAAVVATPEFAASGPVILTDSLKSDEEIQSMVDKYKVSGVQNRGHESAHERSHRPRK